MQTLIYDIIVIGASLEGVLAVKKLKLTKPSSKILVISKTITDQRKDTLQQLNINFKEANVIFSEYNHGLHCISAKTSKTILKYYCSNIIIASGAKHKALALKNKALNKYVYYRIKELPKLSKNGQIIIVGSSKEAVNAALAFSKKLAYVYLCNPFKKLNCTESLQKKLKATANIAYLEQSNIINIQISKTNKVTAVYLDTFGKIHCTDILVLNEKIVNNPGLNSNFIEYDKLGYIKSNSIGITTKIPTIYAIGECTNKETLQQINKLVNHLVNTY